MDCSELFGQIEELVLCHSPSGNEQEINNYLAAVVDELGLEWRLDSADNLVIRIPGRNPERAIAITAHKDEIGAIVKSVGADGRVQVRRLGGAFPWVYGEGVVDLLGDREVVSGILSFGSRHVSHESPQKVFQEDKPLRWEDVWVDTRQSGGQLAQAGIRPGTRMVVGKHRKRPFRVDDYIAGYTLDNKASIAILLALAQRLHNPAVDVYLVATAKEEVGAIGAMYFSRSVDLEAMIALEICPQSAEYPIPRDQWPVLLSQDGYGLYDERLCLALKSAAEQRNLKIQHAVLSQFGSDASIAMKAGHVPAAACLGFPTENTHGFEIAHLQAIGSCVDLLEQFCADYA